MAPRYTQAALLLAAALLTQEVYKRRNTFETHTRCGLLPHSGSFALFSNRVVTPEGTLSAVVHISGGLITAVTPADAAPPGALDYGAAVLSPGLVDLHVHINEPGRTDWEGFESGTRAAAAGGVTTVVVQPLNSFPATTSAEAFAQKLAAAEGRIFVDTAFWGGLVPENAANASRLAALLDAGVLGLKAFMSPSGIDDFGHTTAKELRLALPLLASRGRLPLMVHAELVSELPSTDAESDLYSFATWLASRPREWEERAISQLVELANARTPIHIAHLADAGSLALVVEAKRQGKALTAETCPHYLSFADEDVPRGDTRFKCAPPLRSAANRAKLAAAVVAGEIDILSSDHSPSPPSLKAGKDFLSAWGGIPSLQLSLPASWSALRGAGGSVELLAAAWSQRPAQLLGLARKGAIQAGRDADMVLWLPEESFVVDAHALFHRHREGCPYEGRALQGRVLATFLRGEMVWDGTAHSERACGAALLRGKGASSDER